MRFHKKQFTIGFLLTFLLGIILASLPLIIDGVYENLDEDMLEFSGENAKKLVKNQTELGPRIPGSKANKEARQFIGEYMTKNTNASRFVHNFTVKDVKCQNLLFKLNGYKDSIVIFSTHFDTRAKATKDSDDKDSEDGVLGAIDGGSGTAVLLELARVLNEKKDKLNAEIWFLFFDAEDQGEEDGKIGMAGWDWCEGSKAFKEDMSSLYNKKDQTIETLINIDMVGFAGEYLLTDGYSNSHLSEEIFRVGRNLGHTKTFSPYQVPSFIRDDHKTFEGEFPICLVMGSFLNSKYHHTSMDTMELIDPDSLEIIGQTVEMFVYNNYHKDSQGSHYSAWKERSVHSFYFHVIILLIAFGCVVVYSLIENIFLF